MKKMLKAVVSLSLASMLLNIGSPALVLTVKADEISNIEILEDNDEKLLNDEYIPKSRKKRGAVAIFFAGMVIGWVIDGTIKYATGKAPSEWVAWGLGNVHNYILAQVRNGAGQVVVPTSGPFTCSGVIIDHSGQC